MHYFSCVYYWSHIRHRHCQPILNYTFAWLNLIYNLDYTSEKFKECWCLQTKITFFIRTKVNETFQLLLLFLPNTSSHKNQDSKWAVNVTWWWVETALQTTFNALVQWKEKSDIAPVNGHQMKWTRIVLLRPVAPWIKQPTLTEKRTPEILFCYSHDVTLRKLMVQT